MNLLLELLIALEQNEEALDALCQYGNANFISSESPEVLDSLDADKQLESFSKVCLPESTPLEIASKCVVVLINLKALHLVTVRS